jgi:multidrug efflux pump subunit AcrA (membrane-fusion protein)
MSQLKSRLRTALAVGLGSMLVAGAAHAQLDQALQVARQSTQEGARAQQEINDVADRAGDLEREYLALRQQIEDQRVFVEQQEVFLRSQANELEALQFQLERVSTIERDLTPMLLEMYVALEEFIASDLPFQSDVRQRRLDTIQQLLGDAAVPPAEKYRVILNAYEIEAAYGRSLRTYGEEVEIDGVPNEVTVLQFGRVALVRIFQDGSLEIMTKSNPEWRELSGSHANNVQRALRIAQEVTTPDVFVVPLPGPTVR